ncbi:MAG: hypothetical protein M3018_04210 [Actinomycetota bacterium]|nr:hypothetical protein [Actinomycetota bacterium]
MKNILESVTLPQPNIPRMRGYPPWWFDVTGFRNYVAGNGSTLTGAAPDIAAALNQRFQWYRLSGHDALEPDDLDGYTNKSATGAAGGGSGSSRPTTPASGGGSRTRRTPTT